MIAAEPANVNRKRGNSSHLANLSRAFFAAPLTRQYQTFPKLVWTLTGIAFLIPVVLAIYPALKCRRDVSIEIKLLMWLVLIYVGGALLLPTGPRYWIPVLPMILIWSGYTFERFVSIRIRVGPAGNPE